MANKLRIPTAFVGKNRYEASELEVGQRRRYEIKEASEQGLLQSGNREPLKARDRHVREDKTEVQPHFVSKRSVRGTQLQFPERDQTHDKVLSRLMQLLTDYRSQFVIAEHDPRKPYDQIPVPKVLFRCPPHVAYDWTEEPATANWFDNGQRYIQPDIVGTDSGRPWCGPSIPNIIIEVIHTHMPEPETWSRLVELSRNHHLVMFYLCTPAKEDSRYGHAAVLPKPGKHGRPEEFWLWIQSQFCLRNGEFRVWGKTYRFASGNEALQRQEAIDLMDDVMKRYMRKK